MDLLVGDVVHARARMRVGDGAASARAVVAPEWRHADDAGHHGVGDLGWKLNRACGRADGHNSPHPRSLVCGASSGWDVQRARVFAFDEAMAVVHPAERAPLKPGRR